MNDGLDEDSEGSPKSIKTNGSDIGGAAIPTDPMATRDAASSGKEEAQRAGDRSPQSFSSPKVKGKRGLKRSDQDSQTTLSNFLIS